jgi:tetrahydromethanopterin S-methyltransferase subunit D
VYASSSKLVWTPSHGPREYTTRFIAAFLAMCMFFGVVLFAYEIGAGEAGWHDWIDAIGGVVIAWVFAGFAFDFPGPRAFLCSLWQRIRRS